MLITKGFFVRHGASNCFYRELPHDFIIYINSLKLLYRNNLTHREHQKTSMNTSVFACS